MTIDPVPLAAWATLISLCVTLIGVLVRYERRLTRRLDKQDADVEQLKNTLSRQFGTNGFVLHEKVRALSTSIEAERQRFDQHLINHAEGE